ncbi:MAG: Hpt domain-containing protein, partial [Acidobacteriota bacterium]|nr:Hpt domain-containing protein [Acidobacteriota bacterium]
MTDSGMVDEQVREQVRDAFGRIDCRLVVGLDEEALAQIAAELAAMAALAEQAGGRRLADWAAFVRTTVRDLENATAERAVAALRHGWQSVQDSGAGPELPIDDVLVPPAAEAAPSSTAGDSAELEMLAADPELAGMFIAEALDHLGTIEANVLQLESAPDDQTLLNDVFRPFHTVKGNAGALGVTSVQELAHTVEDLLDRCRSGRHRAGAAEIDIILRAVDLLTSMIQDLQERLAGRPGRQAGAGRRALMSEVERLLAGAAVAAPARPAAVAVPVDAGPAASAATPAGALAPA